MTSSGDVKLIYEVTICKFKSIDNTGLSYRYIIDEKSINKILCVKDNKDMIDINSGNRYHILKHKSNGLLEEEEKNNILLGKEYVQKFNEYNITLSDNKNILKIYLQYLKTIIKLIVNNKEKNLVKK